MNTKPIEWCCVPVIIDDGISELFQLPSPDEDPDQRMAFRVTQATADLVPLDFDRYQPSLQRMVDDWRQQKARVMQMKPANEKESFEPVRITDVSEFERQENDLLNHTK